MAGLEEASKEDEFTFDLRSMSISRPDEMFSALLRRSKSKFGAELESSRSTSVDAAPKEPSTKKKIDAKNIGHIPQREKRDPDVLVAEARPLEVQSVAEPSNQEEEPVQAMAEPYNQEEESAEKAKRSCQTLADHLTKAKFAIDNVVDYIHRNSAELETALQTMFQARRREKRRNAGSLLPAVKEILADILNARQSVLSGLQLCSGLETARASTSLSSQTSGEVQQPDSESTLSEDSGENYDGSSLCSASDVEAGADEDDLCTVNEDATNTEAAEKDAVSHTAGREDEEFQEDENNLFETVKFKRGTHLPAGNSDSDEPDEMYVTCESDGRLTTLGQEANEPNSALIDGPEYEKCERGYRLTALEQGASRPNSALSHGVGRLQQVGTEQAPMGRETHQVANKSQRSHSERHNMNLSDSTKINKGHITMFRNKPSTRWRTVVDPNPGENLPVVGKAPQASTEEQFRNEGLAPKDSKNLIHSNPSRDKKQESISDCEKGEKEAIKLKPGRRSSSQPNIPLGQDVGLGNNPEDTSNSLRCSTQQREWPPSKSMHNFTGVDPGEWDLLKSSLLDQAHNSTVHGSREKKSAGSKSLLNNEPTTLPSSTNSSLTDSPDNSLSQEDEKVYNAAMRAAAKARERRRNQQKEKKVQCT